MSGEEDETPEFVGDYNLPEPPAPQTPGEAVYDDPQTPGAIDDDDMDEDRRDKKSDSSGSSSESDEGNNVLEIESGEDMVVKTTALEEFKEQVVHEDSQEDTQDSVDDDDEVVSKSKGTFKKGLFGSDDSSDGEEVQGDAEHSQSKDQKVAYSQEDLFGEDSSSDDGSDGMKKKKVNEDLEQTVSDEGLPVITEERQEAAVEEEEEDEEPGETCINVDFPLIRANLGKQIHFVKMPNFLSVETRPFDPETYENELDEDEVLDEEGHARLKLKVENTIRWRNVKDEEGNVLMDEYNRPIRESNAKMVRWSDGTFSMYLGSETFDVHIMDTASEHNHLFIRQGSGLQGQAVFKTKMTFRPHSITSNTHRKITLSLADKSSKQQTVKVLPLFGQNPENVRLEALKQEEDRIKAKIRRENILRRKHETSASKTLSSTFLESQEEGEEEGGISLAAIKKKAKTRQSVGAVYSDSGDSDVSSGSLSPNRPSSAANKLRRSSSTVKNTNESDDDDEGIPTKKRPKVVSDDEDEEEEAAPGTSNAAPLDSSSASSSSLDD